MITEVGIFSLFMAIAMSLVAFFSLTGLDNAPPLLGIPRYFALGIPPLALSLLFAIAGVATLATRRETGIMVAIGAGLALGAAFLLFAILTVPTMLFTPVGIAILLIPVVLTYRGRKALREAEQSEQSGPPR